LSKKALAVYLQKYENAANLRDLEREVAGTNYKLDIRKVVNKTRTPLNFNIVERYGIYLAEKRRSKINDILND